MRIGQVLKKNLPVILTAIGTVGVVATAVLAVKATPNAMDILEDHEDDDIKDKILAVAPAYVIPAIVGVGTIACVISAQVINQKRLGRLAASYAALGGLYTKYRDKIKEKIGAAEEGLVNHEVQEEVQDILNDGKTWYKDPITGGTWEATYEQLLQAQLDINEEFAITGVTSLSDFLRLAGAPRHIWNSKQARNTSWGVMSMPMEEDICYIRVNTIDTDDIQQGRRVKELIYNIDPLMCTADRDEVYSTLGYSAMFAPNT